MDLQPLKASSMVAINNITKAYTVNKSPEPFFYKVDTITTPAFNGSKYGTAGKVISDEPV